MSASNERINDACRGLLTDVDSLLQSGILCYKLIDLFIYLTNISFKTEFGSCRYNLFYTRMYTYFMVPKMNIYSIISL